MLNKAIAFEKSTISVMISMYCNHHHKNGEACNCFELVIYAHKRIDACPYQPAKPVCSVCPTHCYKSELREAIRKVMRYAGPRMLLYHPIMALKHLYHKRKSKAFINSVDR